MPGQGDGDQREADGGEGDAEPLTGAHLAAEEAVGHHGEEDKAAGQDGLHEREGSEGYCRDVEEEGRGGHQHADREPLRSEQADRAADRVAQVDIGRRARAAVLEQEAQVGDQGAA